MFSYLHPLSFNDKYLTLKQQLNYVNSAGYVTYGRGIVDDPVVVVVVVVVVGVVAISSSVKR
jgi:hypothetical protein